MTSEVHQDSTIHLHIIIYHSKENSLLVNKAIVGVSHNGEKRRNRSLKSKVRYETFSSDMRNKINKCHNELNSRRALGKKFCGIDRNLQAKIVRYEEKKTRYENSVSYFDKKAAHHLSEYNVNFHMKQSNGKAKGSTYLFKYIMKTTNGNGKDSATKNAAARWYYSARAFSFFGVENSLSKFNFIIENKARYLDLFSDHLKQCLKTHDYYTFLNMYTDFFHVERDQNGAIAFIRYDMQGNNASREYFELKATANYNNQFVLIEKNVYNIVETNQNFFINGTQEIRNIRKLDETAIENAEVFKAYDLVCQKQLDYNYSVENYKMKTQGKFITKAKDQDLGLSNGMIEESVFDDLEYFDEECQKAFISNRIYLLNSYSDLSNNINVTVDQSYSSEKQASKLAFIDLQKLRRENRVEYERIITENHKKWLEDRKKPKQILTTPHVASQLAHVHIQAPKKKLSFGLSK